MNQKFLLHQEAELYQFVCQLVFANLRHGKKTAIRIRSRVQKYNFPTNSHLERLFAVCTRVRAVVGVGAKVVLEPSEYGELLAANVADVAQVVGGRVDAAHVDVQVVAAREPLPANLALVRLGLATLVQRHVLLERRRVGEVLAANVAPERGRLRVRYRVDVQLVQPLVALAALHANERAGRVDLRINNQGTINFGFTIVRKRKKGKEIRFQVPHVSTQKEFK